jgi:spore coat polysaccharide biosynthesis protein SpsF (cytidylyltransferase family)
MKIWDNSVVLIAVRLNSKRLPKKAIRKINGKPLISILIENLLKIIPRKNLVICTSNSPEDQQLLKWSKIYNIGFFSGNRLDVMKRFIDCGLKYNAETIIRVTGDNPLTDPYLIQSMLKSHLYLKSDYTYTVDYPIGTRSEIIKLKSLIKTHANIRRKDCTEYMTYMLKRPDKLLVNKFNSRKIKKIFSNLSLTVDVHKDLFFIKKVLANVDPKTNNLNAILNYIGSNKEEFSDRFIKQSNITIPSRFLYKNEKSENISYCPSI